MIRSPLGPTSTTLKSRSMPHVNKTRTESQASPSGDAQASASSTTPIGTAINSATDPCADSFRANASNSNSSTIGHTPSLKVRVSFGGQSYVALLRPRRQRPRRCATKTCMNSLRSVSDLLRLDRLAYRGRGCLEAASLVKWTKSDSRWRSRSNVLCTNRAMLVRWPASRNYSIR